MSIHTTRARMEKGGKNKLEGSAAVSRNILLSGNLFATLLSLGLVGLGIVVKYGKSVFKDQFASVFDKLTSYAKDAGTGNGMDFSKMDFVSLFGSIATFLIGAGIGALLLAAFGIIAAKKRLFVISVPYTVILGILLLAQTSVIVVVVVKRSLIDRLIKPSLVDGITNGYRGYNETDATSQAWNLAMLTFSCCGVDGYHDFSSARLWSRKLYQDGWWFSLEIPVPCCKMDVKLPDDFSCAVNPSTLNSNYQSGCYEAVISAVDSYRGYLLAGLVAAMLLQVTLFVCAIIVTIGVRPKAKPNDGNEDNETRGSPIGINRYYRQNGYPEQRRTSFFCRQGSDPFQYLRFNGTNHGGGSFGDSFDHLLSSFKPNGYSPQHGIAGLLNAMHGMSAFRDMPGMMFSPPMSQRYGQMSRDHLFDNAVPSQECSLYTRNDAGLTSLGFGRASGPIIVQIPPAITNSPNGFDSRRTSVDFDDDPTLKQVVGNNRPHLIRQQTAPVLNLTPTGSMKNTNLSMSRSNTANGGSYGTGTPTPSVIHAPPLTDEEIREIDRRLRTETV